MGTTDFCQHHHHSKKGQTTMEYRMESQPCSMGIHRTMDIQTESLLMGISNDQDYIYLKYKDILSFENHPQNNGYNGKN